MTTTTKPAETDPAVEDTIHRLDQPANTIITWWQGGLTLTCDMCNALVTDLQPEDTLELLVRDHLRHRAECPWEQS